MHQLLLDIIHPSRFDRLLPSKTSKDFRTQSTPCIRDMLQQIEDSTSRVSNHPSAHIILEPNNRNAFFSFDTCAIVIPPASPPQGLYYAYNWAHEHSHHQQCYPNTLLFNYEMAQISQIFYPSKPVTRFFNQPTKPYICNYSEIVARTASARLLADAYEELSKRYDFTIEDRRILLKEYRQRLEDLREYEMKFNLNAIHRFNEKMLRRYSDDDIVVLNMTARDVREFLEDNGDYLYTQAINRFQRAIRDLSSATVSLEADTSTRRAETIEHQRQLTIQHERAVERAITHTSESQEPACITQESPQYAGNDRDIQDIDFDDFDER